MMFLTVAVCTYRRFDWLYKCLEALTKQTCSSNVFKTLVIDNSLLYDESIKFRQSLCNHTNLEYVITDKAGLSFARNTALHMCTTPYIAYLDDDAIADIDWANNIISAFRRYPAAGVIGGKVDPIFEVNPPAWLKGDLLRPLAVLNWGDQDQYIGPGKWLVGANISYRTDVLKKCGGFNNALGRQKNLLLAHEEYAVNMAIHDMGYDIVYVPSIKVEHLIQKERLSKKWIFENALWDGASKILYEYKIKSYDKTNLYNNIYKAYDESLTNLHIHKTTNEIDTARKKLHKIGRDICKNHIKSLGNDLKFQSNDIQNVIYIVTPCLNCVDTIDQTIFSIISQAGNFSIRYHIQDGESTDGTLDKIKAWQDRINRTSIPIQCRNIVFTYDSSPDHGMYEALVKGFSTMFIPSNAFMTWLNGDDLLMPGSLTLITDVAQKFGPKEASWLTGSAMVFKDDKPIAQHTRQYPAEIIKNGCCDGKHWYYLQQEGTFFRKWLWDKVDAKTTLPLFKYAGDWNLWRLFAHYAQPISVPWALGTFRIRDGQLSQTQAIKYKFEIDSSVSIDKRRRAMKKICQETKLTYLNLHISYSDGNYQILKQTATDRKHYSSLKVLSEHSNTHMHDEQSILTGLEEHNGYLYKKKHSKKNNTVNRFRQDIETSHKSAERLIIEQPHSTVLSSFLTLNDFNYFSYAKKSHLELFQGLDSALYGRQIDFSTEPLKRYQDLLALYLIRKLIPPGSRILEIGGGNSRVLAHLCHKYECWNIDKLEGIGNGPRNVNNLPYRLILNYMGNFTPDLPNKYFDLVFSISALEHIPKNDTMLFDNIINDIDRVLKPGCYSLHLFDIIIKSKSYWSHKFIDYIFANTNTINNSFSFQDMIEDKDLYVMGKEAYDNKWLHFTNKSYKDFGQHTSLNILWQKKTTCKPPSLFRTSKRLTSTNLTRQKYPNTFHIITPYHNSAGTIDKTISSVLSQQGNFAIHYHILDMGSTDGTLHKLKAWMDKLLNSEFPLLCSKIIFSWSTSLNNNLFEAIANRFDSMQISPSDFMTSISANQLLMPGALNTISNIAYELPQVQLVGSKAYVTKNCKIRNCTNAEIFKPLRDKEVDAELVHNREQLQHTCMFYTKRLWFRTKHVIKKHGIAGEYALYREMACHGDFFQYEMPLCAFGKDDQSF